jgi:hypothetical protein
MAYFYFQTSQGGPWVSCNPVNASSELRQSQFCSSRYVNPYNGQYDESPWSIRWLSENHECEWAGVCCNDDSQVNELSLSKCLRSLIVLEVGRSNSA